MQHAVCQARSPSGHRARQKCSVDESREETKENRQIPNCGLSCDRQPNKSIKNVSRKTPTKLTGGNVVTGTNGQIMSSSDIIVDRLSVYGFDAADWLDDSFTDEQYSTKTVKPLPHLSTNKDNKRSTQSCLKIYQDCSGSVEQKVLGQSLKNSHTKVLRDSTNVAVYGSEMLTKSGFPVAKTSRETLSVGKENHKTAAYGPPKTCGVYLTQRTNVVNCKNSAMNSLKMLSRPVGHDVDVHTAKTCSEVYSSVRSTSITTSSSATVSTRIELSSTVTVVTASCHISSVVPSSRAILTSSSVTFHSSTTSAVGRHMSIPSPVTYASPVSSITICSTVFSESMKCQPAGNVQSSFSCSSTFPQLCSSTFKTPQNQSSLKSSCSTKFSTPGVMVTPCNQLVRNSTMKPTPPMCSCGCRAKRKFVQSPGQNMGRSFYCCGSSARSRKGCNFFKWENSRSVTPAAHSSEVTPQSAKQFLSMQMTGGNKHFTTPLSCHTRQATGVHILVPPSFK